VDEAMHVLRRSTETSEYTARGAQRMIGGYFLRDPIHISIHLRSARDGRSASRLPLQRPKPGMSETASIRCRRVHTFALRRERLTLTTPVARRCEPPLRSDPRLFRY
jgi:hypothetical protein